MKELEKYKDEIVESYNRAENTEFSERFENEIVVSENLTIVVEKAKDTDTPTILMVFPEDYFNFSGYQTNFEDVCPKIWEEFEHMFDGLFYYCEKTANQNKYYWIAE